MTDGRSRKDRPLVVLILGSTGVGKSDFAVNLDSAGTDLLLD